MTPNDLRLVLKAQPFRPFDIRLNDGQALSVPHPDFASLSPDAWHLVVWRQDGGFDFVDVPSITSLRFSSRNGTRKSKEK